MSAIIDSSILIPTLRSHLKSRVRSSVNFTFTEELIKIQSSNDFIFDTFLKGEYDDEMINTQFTVIIENSINLLSEEGNTEIKRNGDIIVFEQEDVSIPFNIAYDERVEPRYKSISECGKVSIKDISSIVRGHKSLLNISKILEVGQPPITIRSGKSYVFYSNTILIEDVPMSIPDMEIPYNTFNSLYRTLTGSYVELIDDNISKLIIFKNSINSSSILNYKSPNHEHINAINSRIHDLEYLGEFKINVIDKLEMIYKCFNKEKLTLSFYEDNTLGVLFSVADGKTIKAGCKDIKTLFNISINTAQFDSLYRIFNGVSKLEVLAGRDIVCLRNNKTLILSGMTF